jgi:hypothetical protein
VLTVAWNAGKCHIENDLEFLASAAVDEYSGIDVYFTEIPEFDKGKGDDEKCGNECHW